MSQYYVRTAPKEQYPRLTALVPESEQHYLGEPDAELLIAQKQDEVCGALLFLQDLQGALHIVSIYVREAFRGQGVASLLLQKVIQCARKRGIGQVALTYEASGDEMERHRFVMTHGFGMPRAEACIMTVSLAGLADSALAGLSEVSEKAKSNIEKLCDLPIEAKKDFKRRLGEEIPAALGMTQAPGTLLQQLCLAFVYGDQVIAFVVFCEVEGQLHLHAAYVKDKSCAKALICLLQQVRTVVERDYPQYQTLTITAVTPKSRRLAERLLEGAPLTRRMVYTAYQPVCRTEFTLVPEGFGAALARFNTLTDLLQSRQIESEIYVIPGGMPQMVIPIPDKAGAVTRIRLVYERSGFGAADEFVLHAEAETSSDEQPQERVVETERREEAAFYSEDTLQFLEQFSQTVCQGIYKT